MGAKVGCSLILLSASTSEPRGALCLLDDDPFNRSDLGLLLRSTLQGHSMACAQHVFMPARMATGSHYLPHGDLWPTPYRDFKTVLGNAVRRLSDFVWHICGCVMLTGNKLHPELGSLGCV